MFINGLTEFSAIITNGIKNRYISPENNGFEQYVLATMLSVNPKEYVRYYFYYFKAIKDLLKRTIDKTIEEKEIVIFGVGDSDQRVCKMLIDADINNMVVFCDNNDLLFGTYLCYKEIQSFNVINEK